ncbi:hypothetical protein J1N35_035102 [Gossypium stocksii]|uniref:Ubiquitin-like domain-containing protein n=1 Tax=Gossypium stocksii TaxID=47602 RepID=A0A9D3ZR60_9ROSI|nr:hypothetical protein J1N35_035102 [Gossypium stocksii]
MYIRVKRSKTTYFIQCDPTETTLDIKQKLHTLIDQPVNDQRLILMNTGDILEDSKTLADQKVENDAVVALTLRKGKPELYVVLCLASENETQSNRMPPDVEDIVNSYHLTPFIIEEGRIWKERVSVSVRRRDLPVMQDGGTLQSQSEYEATVKTKPRSTSNRMILPSLSAPEHNLLKLLEECTTSGI